MNLHDSLFGNECWKGNIEAILSRGPVSPTYLEQGFIEACMNGHTECIKLLVNLVDIHIDQDQGFIIACEFPDIAEILVDESKFTNIKYLYDANHQTGYIFGGSNPNEVYNGCEFQATGAINPEFLDREIPTLTTKKSARSF